MLYIFSSVITRVAHSIVTEHSIVRSFLTSTFCGDSAPLNRHCNNRLLPLHLRSRCGGADRSKGHPSSKISPCHTCHSGPFDGASSASHLYFYSENKNKTHLCSPVVGLNRFPIELRWNLSCSSRLNNIETRKGEMVLSSRKQLDS